MLFFYRDGQPFSGYKFVFRFLISMTKWYLPRGLNPQSLAYQTGQYNFGGIFWLSFLMRLMFKIDCVFFFSFLNIPHVLNLIAVGSKLYPNISFKTLVKGCAIKWYNGDQETRQHLVVIFMQNSAFFFFRAYKRCAHKTKWIFFLLHIGYI